MDRVVPDGTGLASQMYDYNELMDRVPDGTGLASQMYDCNKLIITMSGYIDLSNSQGRLRRCGPVSCGK